VMEPDLQSIRNLVVLTLDRLVEMEVEEEE
jgi:hypothetical protein